MAKIIQFSNKNMEESAKQAILELSNYAIYDSTNELLLDSEEIENRLNEMMLNDNVKSRAAVLSGLYFYTSVYVAGDEDNWREYRLRNNNSYYYAVYTDESKILKQKRYDDYTEYSFRMIIDDLAEENENTEIIVNPKSKNSVSLTLQLLRTAAELIEQAVSFVDKLMKEGLKSDSLTDILFERFEFRRVEIKLNDGSIIIGEVTATSYGDEPNANYEVETKEKTLTVYRKDIAFIKEIDF